MKLKTLLSIILLSALVLVVIFDLIRSESNSDAAIEGEKPQAATSSQEEAAETANSGLQKGDVAPEFTLNNLQGEPVSLSDFRGKKVILNFWASWCGPCKEEMPVMQQFYEENQQNDVEVVAVNLTFFERNREAVHQFVEEYGLSFPVLLDEDKKQQETYQAVTIPTSYFVDSKGVIQQKFIGPMTIEYMRETVEQME